MDLNLKRSKGFTLVELLVGLAILAILLGAATMNVSQISRAKSIRFAETQLTSSFSLAKQLALLNEAQSPDAVSAVCITADQTLSIRTSTSGANVDCTVANETNTTKHDNLDFDWNGSSIKSNNVSVDCFCFSTRARLTNVDECASCATSQDLIFTISGREYERRIL